MKRIKIKRVYDKPLKKDGYRILTDRLCPRGITLEKAAIDEWEKELAPTSALRKWFDHDPGRWASFQKKYNAELLQNQMVDLFIESHREIKTITLVYAAKDEQHNHTLVLQQFLEDILNEA